MPDPTSGPTERLVIFGVAGDLGGRYLLPALVELEAAASLPDGMSIVGTGRDAWDDQRLRRYAGEQLDRHAAEADGAARQRLLSRLRYLTADVTDDADVRAAVGGAGSVVAYLALPPSLFEPTAEALGRATAGGRRMVVIEKPFGSDLETAQRLNEALARQFGEHSIIRVDHFLHLPAAQNVMTLRFANRVLEPLWNRQHVAAVDIVWDETLALEGRAGYYDDAGALRDMLQNHLLQLFCLVAMERPTSSDGDELRARRLEVLRSVNRLSAEEVADRTVRARYTAGTIYGRDVPAYEDEDGVQPERETETFAQVTLTVENERWAGVPFTLRSGKALGADRHEIRLRFRPVDDSPLVDAGHLAPNILRLGIDPDTVELELVVEGRAEADPPTPVTMGLRLDVPDVSAYGRVLRDAIHFRTDLSVGAEEAEEAWRVFQPLLDAWQNGGPPLLEYPAGSSGPDRTRRR